MASPPTVDEILAKSVEALTSPYKELRHADKRAVHRSPREVLEAIGVSKVLANGPQMRVVAKPKAPKL